MKTLTIVLLMAAGVAAQDRTGAAAQKGTPVISAGAPALPKGAVEVEPNLYRYTDAQGKTWLARRTPFGFSRWEDKPAPVQPVVQVDTAPPIQATDLGDSVRFQSKTPFGTNTWVRKKTELTAEEKDWFARARENSAPPQTKAVQSSATTAEKR